MRRSAVRILWGLGAGGLGLVLAFGPPAQAQRDRASTTDRVVALVEEASSSPCFQAPSRPPTGASLPASAVAAAIQGDAAAMLRVAEAYLAEPARGGQALPWLERAALSGLIPAAAEAGSMHAAGHGTAQDDAMAAAWWSYGATRGDTRAMACLSAAYLLGRGVPQDTAEAARWAVLREARGGGSRGLLRPALAEFERALPGHALANARREAREMPGPAPPPLPAPQPAPRGEQLRASR
jgi:hypothetical protein